MLNKIMDCPIIPHITHSDNDNIIGFGRGTINSEVSCDKNPEGKSQNQNWDAVLEQIVTNESKKKKKKSNRGKLEKELKRNETEDQRHDESVAQRGSIF